MLTDTTPRRGYHYFRFGEVWYGCSELRNVYASWIPGSHVLIDEGDGAVAPEGAERVPADDAPADVQEWLDPLW